MAKRTVCTIAVLVAVFCCGSAPVAWTQSVSEALNIDCGATTSYTDAAGLEWVPDDAYVPTGTTHQLPPPSDSIFAGLTELKSLRAFSPLKAKNCYRLPVTKNTTYMVRASFYYGSYDNSPKPPTFQLSLEATIVENITPSSTGVVYKELLYNSQSNVTYLCLVRDASKSSPFISAISLRPVTDAYDRFDTYLADSKYMTTRSRINYGGSTLVRYPDDRYNRYWQPEGASSSYLSATVTPIKAVATATPIPPASPFRPPSAVMTTAVTTTTATGSLKSSYMVLPDVANYQSAFLILHFAELDASANATSRQFDIDVGTGGNPVAMNPFNDTGAAFERTTWLFWDRSITPTTVLTLTPSASTAMGPILNSMELYSISDTRRATTLDRDVLAIETIKEDMKLTEWTGDPCFPTPYPWVNCSTAVSVLTPPEVIAIDLSGYNLTGPISPSLSSLLSLTSLSLKKNALTGPIPDLRALVRLRTLHLENNNLSGPLPDWLTTLTELSVQNNNLNGSVPTAFLTNKQFSFCPGNQFVNAGCKEGASKSSNLGVIIGGVVGGIVFALLIVCVGIFCGLQCHRRRRANSQPKNAPKDLPVPLKEIAIAEGSGKGFTLAALTVATNNFKKEIGRGGFGPVYHGILPDGREVAVKVAEGRLDREGRATRQGEKEFYNEVSVLSKLHHRNLTTLVGYCQEKNKQILLYEYVRHGSLHDQLHGNPRPAQLLDWKARLNIALNAAQGLDYLHSSCTPSIIHRDVKSSNILLTGLGHGDVAKLADFGLSRIGPLQDQTHVSTLVKGTAGYLDPQYFESQNLTTKSDVYSFGVVLLELITGRLPIESTLSNRDDYNICQYVRNVLASGGDSSINEILDATVRAGRPNLEGVWTVAEVALRSVEPKAIHRPDMAEVVQELRAAIALEHQPSSASTPPSVNPPHSHATGWTTDSYTRHSRESDISSNVFYESDSIPAPR